MDESCSVFHFIIILFTCQQKFKFLGNLWRMLIVFKFFFLIRYVTLCAVKNVDVILEIILPVKNHQKVQKEYER